MNTARIRVGFIGTGRISDLHALGYLNQSDASIVALCDSDISLAQQRAKSWGLEEVAFYTDYRELLANDEVDMVEILLPHHLHAEVACAAFAAGKAVSLQKPIGLSMDEADRLIDAAEQAKVPFKVFENFVFYPPVAKAKALIDEGAIGTPLSIRIKSNPGKSQSAWHVPAAANAWRQNAKQSGGGPLCFDDGHHKFALAWFFMGQAESVHAWIGECEASDGSWLDAPALISFRFPGGPIGNLEVVYSPELEIATAHYAQDDRVEITGTHGVLWINRGHGQIGSPAPLVCYRDGEVREYHNLETGWETSFYHSTRHFVQALKHGAPPCLTGAQSREILQFALAAQTSAREGRAVDVK